jgi:hypothetical protein
MIPLPHVQRDDDRRAVGLGSLTHGRHLPAHGVQASGGFPPFLMFPLPTGGRLTASVLFIPIGRANPPRCVRRRLATTSCPCVSRRQFLSPAGRRVQRGIRAPLFRHLNTKPLECLCQDSVEPPERHCPASMSAVAVESNHHRRRLADVQKPFAFGAKHE